MYKYTENCIICNRRAKFYTGHVIRNKEYIIAGFCGNDCLRIADVPAGGFIGYWNKWNGIKE